MAKVSKMASSEVSRKREGNGKLLYLNDLRAKKPSELMELSKKAGIEDATRMAKQDLIYSLLKVQSEKHGSIVAEGVLEILTEGYGFLRSPKYSLSSPVQTIFTYQNPR